MRFSRVLAATIVAAAALLISASVSIAGAVVNLPVGSAVYHELELLELRGLIESGMLSTRPFSRTEAARLTGEASLRAGYAGNTRNGAAALIRSLERALAPELSGEPGFSYVAIDPTGPLVASYAHAEIDPYFADVNNNGDSLAEGSNTRARATLSATLLDLLTVVATPEYRLDDTGERGELLTGYAAIDLWGITMEAGRDAMWWGSGGHGGLLMTNNARPLELVKLTTEHPVPLPWVLSPLGLIKPTVFLSRLEGDRAMPRANLLGMRLDFKPTRSFGFALNRVFMFGGKNRRELNFDEWLQVFFVSDEAEHMNSPINGNQLASIDAYYVYVNRSHRFVPFTGVKLYTEWGAEDSSGRTKTPSNRANLYGMLVEEPLWLPDTDLRVEWANTARRSLDSLEWYTHNIYSTGYTYEGDFIGHHMGGDSRDLYVRVNHRINSAASVGLEADFETNGVHKPAEKVERTGITLDLSWRPSRFVALFAAVGYEEADSPVAANNHSGYVSSVTAELSF